MMFSILTYRYNSRGEFSDPTQFFINSSSIDSVSPFNQDYLVIVMWDERFYVKSKDWGDVFSGLRLKGAAL